MHNFLRLCLSFSLLVLPSVCAAQSSGSQSPSAEEVDQSVERALAFLKIMQEKDGSWRAGSTDSPAITGLAVMAFLSAGHVPGEGPYRETVEKGIRWVVEHQQANGVFGDSGLEMYHHGICTLMLAEVAGMTDAKLGRKIKTAVEKGVKVILKAQNRRKGNFFGGWRYSVDATDADLSVTGWQILALRAAKNLGCDIPKEAIDRALSFVRRCRSASDNGFHYQPGGQVTPACTGTGILALELCRKHHTAEALRAGGYLIRHSGLNATGRRTSHFYYSAYYCSQAMFQLGGNYWNTYRPKLFKTLISRQNRNGSWIGRRGLGASYATSMSVLALTVEYRLLPIYQRGSEEEE